MKVLVLYHFYNQLNLMHNYASRLEVKNIKIDIICIDNFKSEQFSDIYWPLLLRKVPYILPHIKQPRLHRYFYSFVFRYILPLTFRKYDIIDFNAYYSDYNPLISKCNKSGKPTVITLWGSDLMRATPECLEDLKFGLNNCKKIKLSDNLLEVLRFKCGNQYDNKCRVVYFGNSDIEVIEKISEEEYIESRSALIGQPCDRLIVCCGYNAIPSQDHDGIIDSIETSPKHVLGKVHFIFPMTYGGNSQYINAIEKRLKKSGVSYTILKSFLEENELATLRKMTDVVINIQSTDAMSASLQDHLFCGGVCIIGEWLHYVPYDLNNIFYLKCRKDNLAQIFSNVISNFDEYRIKCSDNHNKIKKLFSWDAVLDNIVDFYKSIQNSASQ